MYLPQAALCLRYEVQKKARNAEVVPESKMAGNTEYWQSCRKKTDREWTSTKTQNTCNKRTQLEQGEEHHPIHHIDTRSILL